MNIALIGYGKMGKAIEEIALQRGHTIVLKIDIDNADQFTKEKHATCSFRNTLRLSFKLI